MGTSRLQAIYDEQCRAWQEGPGGSWLRAFVEVSTAGLMGYVICSTLERFFGS